jgi:hypothetical protein
MLLGWLTQWSTQMYCLSVAPLHNLRVNSARSTGELSAYLLSAASASKKSILPFKFPAFVSPNWPYSSTI